MCFTHPAEIILFVKVLSTIFAHFDPTIDFSFFKLQFLDPLSQIFNISILSLDLNLQPIRLICFMHKLVLCLSQLSLHFAHTIEKTCPLYIHGLVCLVICFDHALNLLAEIVSFFDQEAYLFSLVLQLSFDGFFFFDVLFDSIFMLGLHLHNIKYGFKCLLQIDHLLSYL